jgi:exosortase family protein XrtF
MFSDFKYSFLFLGKFLLVYFCANLLYGIYIDSFQQMPDPITHWVTNQTSRLQNQFGVESTLRVNEGVKSISMRYQGEGVINVFEGCNGVNVMIVFVAFLVAFGGSIKRMAWFLPLGLLIIHFFNLLRIILLFVAAQQNTRYFYYIHKYFFTAALYVVVIGLWIIWITKLSTKQSPRVEE